MIPRLTILLALAAGPVWAGNPGRAIEWLRGQICPESKLVAGYADKPVCWLYGQALAVIAFAEEGGQYTRHAKDILDFLRTHRNRPGPGECCWRFAYYPNGKRGGEYTTTAVNAWAVMAIAFYEAKTGDGTYRPMAEEALGWIEARCTKTIQGQTGVVMADKNYSASRHDDTRIFSTEHNLDAYAAFRNMAQLTGKPAYRAMAHKLRGFLLALIWDGRRFRGGYRFPGRANPAVYLDAQSWGVLALGPEFASGLAVAEELCLVAGRAHRLNGRSVRDVRGFTQWSKTGYYWAEGTEGMVAAYRVVGEHEKAAVYHEQTRRLAVALDGDPADAKLGVPHASADAKDMSTTESVASTAWFYFNERGVNPFAVPGR